MSPNSPTTTRSRADGVGYRAGCPLPTRTLINHSYQFVHWRHSLLEPFGFKCLVGGHVDMDYWSRRLNHRLNWSEENPILLLHEQGRAPECGCRTCPSHIPHCLFVCGLDREQAGSLSVCWWQSAELAIVFSGMYCVTERNAAGPGVILHLEAWMLNLLQEQ